MAKIRWTSEAEKWLKDIHDYIASDNPAAAAKAVS
jgi:plasmid stabilization system protein ParE